LVLALVQGLLLQAGVLNMEDLAVAPARRGTLGQELFNVWTWEAAIGLSCLLSCLAEPIGLLLLMAAKRPHRPTSRPGAR
jgi:hypothetical protein